MEAVEAAVTNATPEQLADIKKVEADFKVQHETAGRGLGEDRCV
jgi:hypothetical protein